MDIRSDRGFTIAELMISVTVLLFVLSSVYFIVGMVNAAGDVTDRQTLLVREVTTPLHVMDKVLSQNKAIENSGSSVSDAYTLTARSPVDPATHTFTRHIFTAGTDGRLTETVYSQAVGSSTQTLVRNVEWSTHNTNRTSGPLFSYVGSSGESTPAAQARAVIVQIWAEEEGRSVTGKRQVFFRNR